MRVSGSWPGMLTLRHGWAKANARPWNDVTPGASLRLERGSADFVQAASGHLLELGAEWVATPPVDNATRRVWVEAGFSPFLTLDLHGRELLEAPDPPRHEVTAGAASDFPAAVRIDSLAFEPLWQLGSLGLAEARAATPRAGFLVTRLDDTITGFAITGIAGTVGYLQRIAVHPDHRGLGYGRSLLRESLTWCRRRGASQQLLNTQPGNAAAARLYRSEGYSVREGALHVLRYEG